MSESISDLATEHLIDGRVPRSTIIPYDRPRIVGTPPGQQLIRRTRPHPD